MDVAVIEAPVLPVVTWEEAKAQLSLSSDDRQTEIEAMIAAATQALDGPAGWLGRCLMQQTLELRLDEFPAGEILLPYPPVAEIEAIVYVDTNGAEQEAALNSYRLLGAGSRWRLAPVYGAAWPSARAENEAVRIRYRAGYESAEDVPAPIRQAIILMTGRLLSMNRPDPLLRRDTVEGVGSQEWDVSGGIDAAMSGAAEALLQPFRVFA
jgi:uncharacterized phiE125 gp8 family phage protein